MAALTGTIETVGKSGELGQQYWCVGTYTLSGALANADTITWTNLFPKGKFKIVKGLFSTPELDTNASPTGTAIIGDGTTTNAYMTTKNLGLAATAPANGQDIVYSMRGASIGTTFGSTTSLRNVVLTINGVMATSATTGTIEVAFLIEGV